MTVSLGAVFAYFVLAALVAPVLWLAWWAIGSLGDARRLHPSPMPSEGRDGKDLARTRARFDFPRPADVRLRGVRGSVAMYGLEGSNLLATCSGPDRAGKCPRPLADGTVPCAGCVLALPQPIRGSVEWHIPVGYQACLLGSYDVFRQASPAN